MILPTIRASFSRRDVLHLVQAAGCKGDEEIRRSCGDDASTKRVPDAILDDPRVLNAHC